MWLALWAYVCLFLSCVSSLIVFRAGVLRCTSDASNAEQPPRRFVWSEQPVRVDGFGGVRAFVSTPLFDDSRWALFSDIGLWWL